MYNRKHRHIVSHVSNKAACVIDEDRLIAALKNELTWAYRHYTFSTIIMQSVCITGSVPL